MPREPMMKFKLPAGVVVGGMLHLGDGEFAMFVLPRDPAEPPRHGLIGSCSVLEGIGDEPLIPEAADPNELVTLPTTIWEGELSERRRVVLVGYPGGVTETTFARANGIDAAAHNRRVGAQDHGRRI